MNGLFITAIVLGGIAIVFFILAVIADEFLWDCFSAFCISSLISFFIALFFLLLGCLNHLDYIENNSTNQSTPCSQVQEETKPKINENYNYNYNHNYNYNEGETNTTYNVQTTTEPCTCSNCLKEKNTVPTTTQPNTKCTCSNCR